MNPPIPLTSSPSTSPKLPSPPSPPLPSSLSYPLLFPFLPSLPFTDCCYRWYRSCPSKLCNGPTQRNTHTHSIHIRYKNVSLPLKPHRCKEVLILDHHSHLIPLKVLHKCGLSSMYPRLWLESTEEVRIALLVTEYWRAGCVGNLKG